MKIKLKAADTWFSKCIRERANWTCERCGTYYPEDRRCGIECSHFHGRGKWGVRFDPANCEALCTGCHTYLGSNPGFHYDEKLNRTGRVEMDKLLIRANSTNLGRLAKRAEKEICAHYRKEYKLMQERRKNGEIGRIEFQEFKL